MPVSAPGACAGAPPDRVAIIAYSSMTVFLSSSETAVSFAISALTAETVPASSFFRTSMATAGSMFLRNTAAFWMLDSGMEYL